MESRTRRYRSPMIAALAGLALVATLALAGPAISGTTLPKLAKQVKKLKKQVKAIGQQEGPAGSPGQRGPSGANGQPGAPGAPGPVAVHYQTSNLTSIPPNSESTGLRANCPAGQVPVGGGALRETGSLAPPKRAEGLIHSGPVDRPAGDADSVPDAWSVDYANGTADNYNIQVYAICVDPTSTTMATG